MNYRDLLGKYFGEAELSAWLESVGIAGQAEIEGGDQNAFLSNEKAGIECTLSDSAQMESAARDYPDGALVLINIRFYGEPTDDFSAYTGPLPDGFDFGESEAELKARWGEPEWRNPKGNRMRWLIDGKINHVTLNAQGGAKILALGMPG